MMTFEEMALLDAILIQKIEAAQDSTKRTDQQLGEQAFGWLKSPKMKLQSIKGYGDRKPQQLRLADYINICEALGLPWIEDCKAALKAVRGSRKTEIKK